jgi:glycosyltransferase involved in cell wall biosynthesis
VKEVPLHTVHILMATCQGEAYLEQQLKSIEDQSYGQWVLHFSDDGSSDQTLNILKAFKARIEQGGQPNPREHLIQDGVEPAPMNAVADSNLQQRRVYLYEGPRKGSTENFMHLVRLIAKEERLSSGDLLAFADQDDVWLDAKLARAVEWHLNARRQDEKLNEPPMLYAGKPYLVDEGLRVLGLSKTPIGPLSFNAALVENVLSGNTMVMNKVLVELLALVQISHSVWHDWSAYLVATACSGVLYFDEEPGVYYRQHGKNVIGVKTGLRQILSRGRWVFKGRYKTWMQTNLKGLGDLEHAMAPGPQDLKRRFEALRAEKRIWRRFLKTRQLSLRRQNPMIQVVLYVGLVLGFL